MLRLIASAFNDYRIILQQSLQLQCAKHESKVADVILVSGF